MTIAEKNDFMRELLVIAPDLETAKQNLEQEKTELNWYNYGMAFNKLHRYDEAIDAYSQGLIQFPLSSILYFARGRKYMQPETYDMGIADFTTAIQIESDINLYYYYRAVTYNVMGRLEDAIRDFREALKYAQPSDSYSMIDWIFSCYVDLGDMENAKAVLDEIEDDIEVPDMDWDYKMRVRLFKGLEDPETFINPVEIRKHVPDPEDDLKLDIVTLRYGLYLYYTYKGETEKANREILKIINDPFEGAFAVKKARLVAQKKGLK